MALSDLDKLIVDFATLNTQKRMQTFIKPYLDELIVIALYTMGIRTIGDTNQAKSLFVDIAMREFNRDISWIYSVPTDLWGNSKRRGVGKYSNYVVTKTEQGGYTVEIEMEDYGLYGQEYYGTSSQLNNGGVYPSPRRSGSGYEARHISNTQDDLDDGNISDFENILDLIETLFVERFEGRI